MAHFLFFCRYPKVRLYQFERGRETETYTRTETHRQTDRQAWQAGRQTDRQTDRDRDRDREGKNRQGRSREN